MSMASWFDVILCLGLLGLAWGTLQSKGLFRSIVLFMAFGLLMAVAWVRLEAPDLALAEAIIGAGITGALLLNACQGLVLDRPETSASAGGEFVPVPRWLLAAGCTGLAAGLAWLLSSLQPARVTANAADHLLAEHVMRNPVTAVLLDFRGYDTLLEMVVLLLALVGIRVLNLQERLNDLYPADAPRSPLVEPFTAVIVPVAMIVSAYLYWAGSTRPGGAFQAGALLGAVGILLRLSGSLSPSQRQHPLLQFVVVLGVLVFSIFALSGLLWSGHAMAFPTSGGYYIMVAIEGCLTLSIGITLVLLFVAAPGLNLRKSAANAQELQ